MLADKSEIQELIPQKAPFVMIDELYRADDNGFESKFEIKADNLFVNENSLSESAVIENIAQTCAAGFGYIGKKNGEGAGRIGFIGAVSQLTNIGEITVGDHLSTKVEILNTFDNIHLAQGIATTKNGYKLSCQLKIVLT